MLHHNCAVFNIKNEDKCFLNALSEHACICGIADGHGGGSAAKVCRENISKIQSAPPSFDDLFTDLHERCLQLPCASGASLTVCVIDDDKVKCANVGDSHALVVTPTSYYWLTESHRLQNNSRERTHLLQHIGFVTDKGGSPIGPPRLYPGGLACSRSIGDADCPHVNCKPFVCEAVLNHSDILVVASDGLWDTIKLSRICKVARESYSATALLRESTSFHDDTSVIVVSHFPERSTLFRRVSSNSSISSDDDNMPQRKIIRVKI